jgi:hypothetical protein
MITGKLNLAKLVHVVQLKKNKEGKEIECLVIPIEANHLFKGKDGNVYLDMVAFDLKKVNETTGDTHLVKQSLPKDVRESMTEEQKNNTPIIGNLKVGGSAQSETPNNAAPGVTLKEDDDLPF